MTDATHSIVPYQTPHVRAFSAATNAALAFGAAVLLIIIPLLKDYLDKGVFTKAQTVTLLTAIGTSILGVLFAYVVKYIAAHGNDQQPTVDALGASPARLMTNGASVSWEETNAPLLAAAPAMHLHANAIAPPELPGIDPHVLVRLMERNLTDHLDRLDRQASEDNALVTYTSTLPWTRTVPPATTTASGDMGHSILIGKKSPPLTPEPVVGKRKRVIPPVPEAETPPQ